MKNKRRFLCFAIFVLTAFLTLCACQTKETIKHKITFDMLVGEDVVLEVEDGASITPPNHSVIAGYDVAWDSEVASNAISDATYREKKTARTDTKYYVEHYKKNVGVDGYTKVENDTETLTGTTDTLTTAHAKDYEGYSAKSFNQEKISGDGSTVIKIYYNPASFTVTFDMLDGEDIVKNVEYGETLVAPEHSEEAGYSFGWDKEVVANPTEDTTYVETKTANTNTPYKVLHYKQNVENEEYTLVDTDNLVGTTDTLTNAVAKTTYEGYRAKTFTQVNINGDGTTEVKIYYDINFFYITFDMAEGDDIIREVKPGANIEVPNHTVLVGYDFGWNEEIAATATTDKTYVETKTAKTNIPYKVLHYKQNVDDEEYTLADTDNLVGTTDTLTNAVAKTTYEGYTAASFTQVNINGDGSTEISIYYDYNTCKVTWIVDGEVYDETLVKNGNVITNILKPYKNGYTFSGWLVGDNPYNFSNVITEEVTLEGSFTEVEGMFIDFNDATMANVWSSAGTSSWLETYDDAYGVIKLDITEDITGDGNWWGPNEGNDYWKPAFEKDYYTGYDRLVVKYQAVTTGSYKIVLFTGNGAWEGKVVAESDTSTDSWQYAVLDYSSVEDCYDILKNFCFNILNIGETSIYIDSICALKTEDSVEMWQSFGSTHLFWASTGEAGWLYEYQGAQGVIYNKISAELAGNDKFIGGTEGTTSWFTENLVTDYDENANYRIKIRLLIETESSYVLRLFFGTNNHWNSYDLISGSTSTDGWQEISIDVSSTILNNMVEGFDTLNKLSFISNTSGATNIYIDSIRVVKTFTVNYDDMSSEYVENGSKARGALISGACVVEKWQLDGEDFDFNTPITSDITLTAVNPVKKVWYDYNSASDVRWGHLAITFDQTEGVNGALKFSSDKGVADGYVGADDQYWQTLLTKEECVGKTKLILRAKIEGNAFNALTLFGVPFASFGKIYNDQLATNGYQDFVLNIDVYENYDAIKNFFLIEWCNDATSVYLDYILVE